MTDINSQTLHVVAKELASTLNEARAALETYAERPDQVEQLQKCGEHLHQAHGVLRLVEVYGAALLAEEMEQVTRHLLDVDQEKKHQVDGLDALMRSMVQLPTYLERVLSGGRDLALILLPLLNDLRAVRGSPLLSEGTLLLLNLKSDQPAHPQPARPGEPPLSVTQWARRMRTRFQSGLLGLIRGDRVEQNLEAMAKVAEKLEQVATTQPVFQLWWVTGALLEALRANGLESSATLKRLLGQADRQIKRLYEIGEARYCESPPIDLLNNMLYYVARASTSGGRIGAVRASFKLVELLPVDESVEQERESLSAPSVKLMHTVADAIKEDLSKVKDVLDIFVRRGGGQVDELQPQLDLLKKISDTLGVLGLGELRQRVQTETTALSEPVSRGATPSEDALLKMAATLLSVEDSLDEQLVRLILPGPSTEGAGGDDIDFKGVTEAVLRECIVNLARVKEAISVAVSRPGDAMQQGLENVPQLLRGITAGLLMLGKGRAVELMDGIGAHVRKLVEPGAPMADPMRLERIADAIVSLEYYMETLQSGRSDPWYMLDNAEICLKTLEEDSRRVPPFTQAVADVTKTVRLDLPPVASTATAALAAAAELVSPAQAAPAASTPVHAAAVQLPDHIDPQFLELFIEEAKEEITSIEKIFPMWDQNPMDSESLLVLRRSFHTLKGSGRMVGARLMGEFGWSIENLLNRLIDKTLTRTPGIMAMMRSAVAALPALVEQLESGRPLATPVEPIMARAYAYADGRDPDEAVAQLAAGSGASAAHVGARGVSGTAASNAAAAPAAPQAVAAPSSSISVAASLDAIAASHDSPAQASSPAAEAHAELSASAEAEPMDAAEWFQDAAALEEPAAAERAGAEPAPAPMAEEPGMDPVLHDIYSKETAGHLLVIRDYLKKRLGQPAPHDMPEGVYRAIHTLSGSSKMAEARHGIRITEPLNHYMRKVFDSNRGLSDEGLHALNDAVTAIDNVVAHINESTAFFAEQPLLVQRLQDLEVELDADLAHDAANVSQSAATTPPGLASVDAVSANEWREHEARASEATQISQPPAEVTHHTPEIHEPPTSIAATDAVPPAARVPTRPPMAEEQHAAAESEAGVEFDSEIAGIYSEEATELLEAAQISLNGWIEDRADRAQVAELQRHLHTLKGGARMAGVTAMGNLSHELETLVVDIDSGLVAIDDRTIDVMQASLDELARMRDLLSAEHNVPAADGLIARIRALTGSASAAAVPAAEGAASVPAQAPSGEEIGVVHAEAAMAPIDAPAESVYAPAQAVDVPVQSADLASQPIEASRASSPASITIEAARPTATIEAVRSNAAFDIPRHAAMAETPAVIDTLTPADVDSSLEANTAPVLPGRDVVQPERAEMARVDADLLDTMLNNAGEVSIFRARLDQQVSSIDFNLAELARTVTRLKDQLRGLEIETEAQVLHRHQDIEPRHTDFDPLELDRYSTLQQFSRALAETSSDVASIQGLLEALTREAQNLLTQQARVITELQNGLMRTRMVPFQRHVQRLTRLVRQAANDTHKRAELAVEGAAAELDRQVLERMVPPLEHLLRNAVVHGIETPERRLAAGKPEVGRISVSIERDGAEVVIIVADDGGGINIKLIREKALSLGLADPNHKLTDEEAMQLILEPGFSTAGRITQAAGRGVGMDVVATEVKKLGGGLFIESTHGLGSRFTIRLPFTLAISQALIVRVVDEIYALPLATVEGVVRLPKTIVARHLGRDAPPFEYGAQKYKFQQLGAFVGLGATPLPEADVSMSVVLIRAGEHSTALVTDELVGSREIVVKSLGPQVSAIRGIAGATILGDGRIVVILDMGALVRSEWRAKATEVVVHDHRDRRTFALVVDDSITVRRVTQRLLERNGMRVITAKDGVDAVSVLQEHLPDVVLLDIEMPRMDGYEVAAHIRNDARLKDIPIVMITSRVSEKHRARAIEIGVDDYLGKPYQENQLLDAIEPLVHRRRAMVAQERG